MRARSRGESCPCGEVIAESDGVFPRDVREREVFVRLAIRGVVEHTVILAARDGMAGEGVRLYGDAPSPMATCVAEFDRCCWEGDEARSEGVEQRRLGGLFRAVPGHGARGRVAESWRGLGAWLGAWTGA